MRVVNTLLADLPASSTKPITPSNIVLKWRFKLRSTQLVTGDTFALLQSASALGVLAQVSKLLYAGVDPNEATRG
jgi:hypothetical protein